MAEAPTNSENRIGDWDEPFVRGIIEAAFFRARGVPANTWGPSRLPADIGVATSQWRALKKHDMQPDSFGNDSSTYCAFKRAAQGRGRIKKGPHAGRRVGMLILWRGDAVKQKLTRAYETFKTWLQDEKIDAMKRAARLSKKRSQILERIEFTKELAVVGRSIAFFGAKNIRSESPDASSFGFDALEKFGERLIKAMRSPGRLIEEGIELNGVIYRPTLAHLRSWAVGHPSMWRCIESEAARRRVTLTKALLFLEREAFRAYLKKRVKPSTRRTRAPRPFHAQPRPPTAPLAPPV